MSKSNQLCKLNSYQYGMLYIHYLSQKVTSSVSMCMAQVGMESIRSPGLRSITLCMCLAISLIIIACTYTVSTLQHGSAIAQDGNGMDMGTKQPDMRRSFFL